MAVAGGLVLAFFVLSTSNSSASSTSFSGRIDLAALESLLENDASSTAVGAVTPSNDPGGLTSLGKEADDTYHLGSTDPSEFRSELASFVTSSFPPQYRDKGLASLSTYLPPDLTTSSTTKHDYPHIPHKIWQTAKIRDPNRYPEWKEVSGYDYTFMNDEAADKWVQKEFAGSRILWTWEHLGSGILKSDLLRYLLILVEGGVYTDTDTHLLKPIDAWGEKKGAGAPSIIVGVEADVGDRQDWHEWWPRPLQIAQWTIAAAPFHPVLIDVVRRIHDYTVKVEKWKEEQGLTGSSAATKVNQLMDKKGSHFSVMEWTGATVPGTPALPTSLT